MFVSKSVTVYDNGHGHGHVIKVTTVMELCTYAAITCTAKQRVIISVTE